MFRKSILTFTLVSALAANMAFAATPETQVNTQVNELAGIKAESVLHPVDEAIEKIQLLIAADGESKANLLNSISQERIAELKILNEKHKEKFVYKLIKNYLHTIEKLEKQLQIALEKEEDVQKLIKELNEQKNETSKILTAELKELSIKEQNEIKPQIEEAKKGQEAAIEVIEVVEIGKKDESSNVGKTEENETAEKTEENKTDEKTEENKTDEKSKEELKRAQYQRVQEQSHEKAKAYGLIKNNKKVVKEEKNEVKKENKKELKKKEVKKEKENNKELKKELKKQMEKNKK